MDSRDSAAASVLTGILSNPQNDAALRLFPPFIYMYEGVERSSEIFDDFDSSLSAPGRKRAHDAADDPLPRAKRSRNQDAITSIPQVVQGKRDEIGACRHTGCGFVTNVNSSHDRQQRSINNHARNFKKHEKHFASGRESCRECQRLLAAGIWASPSQGQVPHEEFSQPLNKDTDLPLTEALTGKSGPRSPIISGIETTASEANPPESLPASWRSQGTKCGHSGCPFISHSNYASSRQFAIASHERNRKKHREHFATLRHSCPKCQQLLADGTWNDSKNIEVESARAPRDAVVGTGSEIDKHSNENGNQSTSVNGTCEPAPCQTFHGPDSQRCPHLRCPFVTKSTSTSAMNSHVANLDVHGWHYRALREVCSVCEHLIRTGTWTDSMTRQSADSGEARCSHVGCSFTTHDTTSRARNYLLAQHELSVKQHYRHVEYDRDVCATCQQLVAEGVWSEPVGRTGTDDSVLSYDNPMALTFEPTQVGLYAALPL